MPEHNNTRIINDLLFVLYLAFFVSLIFAFRAVSSISVALLIATGIVKNRVGHKSFFNRDLVNPDGDTFVVVLLGFIPLPYTTRRHGVGMEKYPVKLSAN